MTERENDMRERIYSLEGQLVKAATMITEARERAEAAEEEVKRWKDAAKNLALSAETERDAAIFDRAVASGKVKLVEARAEEAEKEQREAAASSCDAWAQRNAIYAELTKVQARAEAAEKALQAITALPSVDGLTETERTRQELRLIEQARQIARAALKAKP